MNKILFLIAGLFFVAVSCSQPPTFENSNPFDPQNEAFIVVPPQSVRISIGTDGKVTLNFTQPFSPSISGFLIERSIGDSLSFEQFEEIRITNETSESISIETDDTFTGETLFYSFQTYFIQETNDTLYSRRIIESAFTEPVTAEINIYPYNFQFQDSTIQITYGSLLSANESQQLELLIRFSESDDFQVYSTYDNVDPSQLIIDNFDPNWPSIPEIAIRLSSTSASTRITPAEPNIFIPNACEFFSSSITNLSPTSLSINYDLSLPDLVISINQYSSSNPDFIGTSPIATYQRSFAPYEVMVNNTSLGETNNLDVTFNRGPFSTDPCYFSLNSFTNFNYIDQNLIEIDPGLYMDIDTSDDDEVIAYGSLQSGFKTLNLSTKQASVTRSIGTQSWSDIPVSKIRFESTSIDASGIITSSRFDGFKIWSKFGTIPLLDADSYSPETSTWDFAKKDSDTIFTLNVAIPLSNSSDGLVLTEYDLQTFSHNEFFSLPDRVTHAVMGFDEDRNELFLIYTLETGSSFIVIFDGTSKSIIENRSTTINRPVKSQKANDSRFVIYNDQAFFDVVDLSRPNGLLFSQGTYQLGESEIFRHLATKDGQSIECMLVEQTQFVDEVNAIKCFDEVLSGSNELPFAVFEEPLSDALLTGVFSGNRRFLFITAFTVDVYEIGSQSWQIIILNDSN